MVTFGLGSIEFSRVFTFFTPGGGGGGFADPLLGISLLRKLFQKEEMLTGSRKLKGIFISAFFPMNPHRSVCLSVCSVGYSVGQSVII